MTVADFTPAMKWRIRFLRMLKVVLALSVLYSICWYFFWRGPVAHSDVPVTAEMGFWPYQNGLKITEFTAQSINPQLNLFSARFVMRFHIKGTIKLIGTNDDWKPSISKVQITGRVKSRSFANENSYTDSVADVLLVPIVKVIKDTSYSGAEIPFDLIVEHVFETMDWGTNRFECTCEGKEVSVVVHQRK
jgi:hypothetical protein